MVQGERQDAGRGREGDPLADPGEGCCCALHGRRPPKVVRTNAKGVARYAATPSKAGIMLVKITSVKACNSARIGVVGVFEPPVTG